MHFGLIADRDLVPDLEDLAEALATELAELVETVTPGSDEASFPRSS